MKAELNTIFIADPINILQEFDSEQFDLVYIDTPPLDPDVSYKKGLDLPYSNFEEYLEYVVFITLQAHRLLKGTGSVLIRNSPSSLFNTRLFLDRIFGKLNFRAEIIWGKRIIGSLGISGPHVNFDTVFFYSKSDKFIYYEPTRELSQEEINLQYQHKDERGKYKLWPLIYNVSRPERNFEWDGFTPPKGKCWKYSRVKLIELSLTGEIDKSGKFLAT